MVGRLQLHLLRLGLLIPIHRWRLGLLQMQWLLLLLLLLVYQLLALHRW